MVFAIIASIHTAEKLLLEDVLALLVLLCVLICLVVLPANNLLTLSAANISYGMSTCSHVTVASFALLNVDD